VIIGGAIGAIGGFLGSRSANEQTDEQRERQTQALLALRPKRILKMATQLTPRFRGLVAAGIGPTVEQRTAANLARSGLADTGAGEALRNLSYQVPGAIASQGALEFARQTSQAYAGSLLGAPSLPASQSAILQTLAGGLQGGLGTFLALQKAKSTQENIAGLQARHPDLIPGNAPSAPDRGPYFPPPEQPRGFTPPRGPLF
jgi:hypothetical protein